MLCQRDRAVLDVNVIARRHKIRKRYFPLLKHHEKVCSGFVGMLRSSTPELLERQKEISKFPVYSMIINTSINDSSNYTLNFHSVLDSDTICYPMAGAVVMSFPKSKTGLQFQAKDCEALVIWTDCFRQRNAWVTIIDSVVKVANVRESRLETDELMQLVDTTVHSTQFGDTRSSITFFSESGDDSESEAAHQEMTLIQAICSNGIRRSVMDNAMEYELIL